MRAFGPGICGTVNPTSGEHSHRLGCNDASSWCDRLIVTMRRRSAHWFVVLLVMGLAGCGSDPPVPTAGIATSAPRPAVSSSPPALTTSSSLPSVSHTDSTRGLMSDVTWWNKTFGQVPETECTDQGEDPIGEGHAWRLAGGVACADEPGPVTWSGKLSGFNLYFPGGISERAALKVATELLPLDAISGPAFDGVNPNYPAKPGGTCREVTFTSAGIGDAVQAANPTWEADPTKATLGLYSGRATSENGAEVPYRSDRVALVSVTIGGENRGADGSVHC